MGWLRSSMWIRSVALAALVAGALIYWIWRIQPGAFIPWPQIISALTVAPLGIFAYGCLLVFVPTLITVRTDWIVIQSGQSVEAIPAEKIRSASIETDDNGSSRLVIACVTRRGAERTIERAVGKSVDLDKLHEVIAAMAERRHLTRQPLIAP